LGKQQRSSLGSSVLLSQTAVSSQQAVVVKSGMGGEPSATAKQLAQHWPWHRPRQAPPAQQPV
jgi:hypothetical protein